MHAVRVNRHKVSMTIRNLRSGHMHAVRVRNRHKVSMTAQELKGQVTCMLSG